MTRNEGEVWVIGRRRRSEARSGRQAGCAAMLSTAQWLHVPPRAALSDPSLITAPSMDQSGFVSAS